MTYVKGSGAHADYVRDQLATAASTPNKNVVTPDDGNRNSMQHKKQAAPSMTVYRAFSHPRKEMETINPVDPFAHRLLSEAAPGHLIQTLPTLCPTQQFSDRAQRF